MLEQFIKREPDVFGDLAEQYWGDVSTLMKWNRCAVTSRIPKLFMRSALSDPSETKFNKNCDDFIWFEDGNIAHGSRDGDVLNPNKL